MKDIILAIVSIIGTLVGIFSFIDALHSKRELKKIYISF